jgi:predicted nucleotidyltransferase
MEIALQIVEKLLEIQREHNIRIPLAFESGSRAWGFASPDSDYDCRFIYVRPVDSYLSVFEDRDTIEYAPDAVFDISGWDIKKVIQHLVKSNAVMLEWLSSCVIYCVDGKIQDMLRALGQDFFNPVSVGWHYLSMAKKVLEEIKADDTAKIKKYCYVLRPLACVRYIQTTGQIPHMEYRRNLDEIAVKPEVRAEIEALLREKETAAEGHRIPANRILLEYFNEETAWAEEWLGTVKHEKLNDPERANKTFREIVRWVEKYD